MAKDRHENNNYYMEDMFRSSPKATVSFIEDAATRFFKKHKWNSFKGKTSDLNKTSYVLNLDTYFGWGVNLIKEEDTVNATVSLTLIGNASSSIPLPAQIPLKNIPRANADQSTKLYINFLNEQFESLKKQQNTYQQKVHHIVDNEGDKIVSDFSDIYELSQEGFYYFIRHVEKVSNHSILSTTESSARISIDLVAEIAKICTEIGMSKDTFEKTIDGIHEIYRSKR
ncbi:MAG: hypothetical protein ACK4NC_02260 [Candidatus Gracilibacteria bacterium]